MNLINLISIILKSYGVEATLGSSVPKETHKILVCINGSYGDRMAKICKVLGLNSIVLTYKDNEIV